MYITLYIIVIIAIVGYCCCCCCGVVSTYFSYYYKVLLDYIYPESLVPIVLVTGYHFRSRISTGIYRILRICTALSLSFSEQKMKCVFGVRIAKCHTYGLLGQSSMKQQVLARLSR